MIKTVNDLLVAIKNKGVKEIEPFLKTIKHSPTIGDMYEGLTKDIASKALFESTDIRVASGFITNSDGDISKQIDCMIVVGDGKQIPNTNDYIYDVSKVIMVIEVKKNLHSKELSDGYDNLRSVYNVTKPDHGLRANMIDDAFEVMTGKRTPDYKEVDKLPLREQLIFHSLVVEALLPLRVIFGFNGFKTELSLRNKFKEYLDEKCIEHDADMTLEEAEKRLNSDDYDTGNRLKSKYGFGIVSLPNLIVAGDNSIVKTSGMPYGLVCEKKDITCWMASYRRNPLILFLELLWTRLTYYYDFPTEVFGNNVQLEGLAPLLFATGTKNGWIYQFYPLDEKGIAFYDKDKAWKPALLDQNEFILMNLLCEGKEVKVEDASKLIDGDIDTIVKRLNKVRLIYVDENGFIRLLTKECKCMFVPGVGCVAGDDNDGRLMNWLNEWMKMHLKEKRENLAMEFSIDTLTIDDVKKLIASGDDSHDNQIRVSKEGIVFLSAGLVGAEDIDNLAFRFDTFDSGTDYVGENAAKDDVFINRIYKALKANWPVPKSTYIDDWNIEGLY